MSAGDASSDLVISDEAQMKILQALNNNSSFNQGDFIANINTLSAKVSSVLTGSPLEKTNQLRAIFEAANKNLRDAPDQVAVAERNYYVYEKGQVAYNTMLYDRFAKTAKDFQLNSLVMFQKFTRDLNLLIEHYRISNVQSKRVNDLLIVKRRQNKQLQKEVLAFKGHVNTNARKVAYEDKDQGNLLTIRKVLVFIYYALLVLYLLFGDFLPNAQYKNRNMWLALLLYILLPWVFNWFVKKMFALTNLIEYVTHQLPYKNAYVDI
jgi:hypothetical protein